MRPIRPITSKRTVARHPPQRRLQPRHVIALRRQPPLKLAEPLARGARLAQPPRKLAADLCGVQIANIRLGWLIG